MSNIHRISDFNDNNENRSRSNSRGGGLLGSSANVVNPRQQTFFGFLKNFCCPNFSFKSFIFIITIIEIILYIITLCFGLKPVQLGQPELLAPTPQTLENFGGLVK